MNNGYILKLTLLSDALPGSGEGVAGIIDADVSHDPNGLPIIPAKRVKGILREAAKDLEALGAIEEHTSDILFGTPGRGTACELRISNGHLSEHDQLAKFLRGQNNPIYNKESVLRCFSYLRHQTSLDEGGIAKENTLRVKRVLRKGLEFFFECSLPARMEEPFRTICKAARHFGSDRTRGLGEIKIELQEMPEPVTDTIGTGGGDAQIIRLKIRNQDQLLVSHAVGRAWVSVGFIPGTAILGAFASKYIKAMTARQTTYNPSNDQDFHRLFISSEIKWGNAYPAHGDTVYYPAPLSWKQSKEKKRYYDLSSRSDFDAVCGGGIALKSAECRFISQNGPDYESFSPDLEVVYHHQRPQDRTMGSPSKGDGEFYQFEVLSPWQEFVAEIRGDRALLDIIRPLLTDRTLFLGKSKTAQYGLCEIFTEETDNPPLTASIQGEIRLRLISDAAVLNSNGSYSLELNDLVMSFARSLGSDASDWRIVTELSHLGHVTIGGFMGIWGLPRMQVPAFRAGSIVCLIYQGARELQINHQICIGEHTERGFGMLQVYNPLPGFSVKPVKPFDKCEVTPVPRVFPAFEPLYRDHLMTHLKASALAVANRVGTGISSSQIRRVMAAVSTAADPAAVIDNLDKIKSFKDKKPKWVKPAMEDNFFTNHLQEALIGLFKLDDANPLLDLLGISPGDAKTWMQFVRYYSHTYLRCLALRERTRRKGGEA